jgi:uncharacterized caspase-like protein
VIEVKFDTFNYLDENSRLFFYYSGHGSDYGGKTGYMQFAEAKKNDSVHNVLAINTCEEWSKMLKIKYILFVFDCCVSGLAFTLKGNNDNHIKKLVDTMSGNGSRIVLTAGTKNEKSFGINKHSVFTKALLDSLKSDRCQNDGLLFSP